MIDAEPTSVRLQHLVIAGGGTAGWMAAAALAKALAATGTTITLVESEEIGTVGVGEATIPTIKAFNALLGFDEQEFLRRTNGTFKLGIEFINWGHEGSRYIHPFGAIGVPHGPLSFYHYWQRYHQQGKSADIGDYCLAVGAARANKFLPPLNRPGSILHHLNYAYHFDASLYASYLREYAEKLGVTRVEGKITQANLDDRSGAIASLALADGRRIAGDFFIDCTGFRALLIEGALNTGFDDWGNYLLCDSALAVQSTATEAPRPYTRATAHSAGWQWQIPLQTRMGNGHVYASRYMDDDQAKKILLQNISGEPLSEPRQIRFKVGRRKKFWNKNCVAIGLASGFLEPLESTSIYLIQTAIVKLINLFPCAQVDASEVQRYNDMIAEDYQFVRDFIILHYKATERDDSAFWRYCRGMELPETLQQKFASYSTSGRIHIPHNEIFREESWVAVMQGQGVQARDYHPLADVFSEAELEQFMAGMLNAIRQTVANMPSHEEFISRYCATDEFLRAASSRR